MPPSNTRKKTVVIGLLGTTLDGPRGDRWRRWRPTVDLCRHEDWVVDRLELLASRTHRELTEVVVGDIQQVSPETIVRTHDLELTDPWDFEEVYEALHDFAVGYDFVPEREDYLVHISTGSHVAQICEFLLTESRYFPARLLQTGPPKRQASGEPGTYSIIDLDLSKYDRLASRFEAEQRSVQDFLKSGIATRSETFNQLIELVERVAVASRAPLLLTGPTGAGKTRLAERIYELKRQRRQLEGPLVEVNCATLRGDGAMSALFGHVRGAFTGAVRARDGLLRQANGGLLFLDEIGELGLDEQAMLLRALEKGRFLPVGSDREVESSFQLISGTNRQLQEAALEGSFREDLLARINLWSFALPGLAERPEDLEPNLDYELDRWQRREGKRIRFSREARDAFLDFARAPTSTWSGNFRDFTGAVERMATLAPEGRISPKEVHDEVQRLERSWQRPASSTQEDPEAVLSRVLSPARLEGLDRFDRVQLADVVQVCLQCDSLSAAGRILFTQSRKRKASSNDSDRVRKYLARFGLTHADIERVRLGDGGR